MLVSVEAPVELEAEKDEAPGHEDVQGEAKFFVVISRKTGFRRLHKSRCCGVIPWECHRVAWLKEVTSKSADAQCKACLKTCGKLPPDEDASTSGSSSSTDGEIAGAEEDL